MTADNELVSNSYLSNNPDLPVRSSVTASGKLIQHVRIDYGTGTAESTGLPTTSTFTRPSIADNATTEALAANTIRKKAIIMNNTDQTFWIKEGVTAVLSQGFPISSGNFYSALTTGALNVIQNSGGPLTLDVVEIT